MKENTQSHFDSIAGDYHEEISEHVRDHLINKWWGIVSSYFMSNPRVLDIGCGEGSNVQFMAGKNINAVSANIFCQFDITWVVSNHK